MIVDIFGAATPRERAGLWALCWLVVACVVLWLRRQPQRVQARVGISVCLAAVLVFAIVGVRTPPKEPAEWVGWGMALLTPIVGLALIRTLPKP